METKGARPFLAILFVFAFLGLSGCASAPKQTVLLSEVTEEQVASLHASHIRFIQLYYQKLRDEVNDFVDRRWMPLFLSKAVRNEAFRKDLDDAYVTSSISPADVQVTWKGRPLPEPQKGAILSGVEQAVTDSQSRLGKVLLDFSEAAQREINKKRQELLTPINDQERMVIGEINAAYADLQGAQASIKGYLASVVELKERQDATLDKLGVLERRDRIMNTVLDANGDLAALLQGSENPGDAVRDFLAKLEQAKKAIKSQPAKEGSGGPSVTEP